MTALKTKILDTLKNNNLKMIPKWKFVLYASLGILGMGFLFLLAIFTFSLVIFVLSKYGSLHLPFFEFMGALHALSAIPVVLLLLTVVLLIVIEVISRNYSFAFRRPLGITILLVTTLAVTISFAISMTPMHEYIRDYAKTHRLDFVSKAYDRPVPFKPRNGLLATRGIVTDMSSSTISLQLFDGTIFLGYISTSTKTGIAPTLSDDVVIFGVLTNEKFVITEVRQAPRGPFKKPQNKRGGEELFKNEINRQMPR